MLALTARREALNYLGGGGAAVNDHIVVCRWRSHHFASGAPVSAKMSSELLEALNANALFMAQCVIAASIGGLEFCFPALFVDTFNTFEVYTSHRLYGAAMIVNAIVVFSMRNCNDHRVKKEVVQAFLFQFGLHIIVLLRPQVWGFLTVFNKVNLLCSFALAAAYGYLLMGNPKKMGAQFSTQDKLSREKQRGEMLETDVKKLKAENEKLQLQLDAQTKALAELKKRGK